MVELFQIYSSAFVLIAITSLVLPFIGTNLMAQKRVTEFLSLTQFAVLSLFIGFLLFHHGPEHVGELGPLLVSISLTSIFFFTLNGLKNIDNNFFLMLYIFFLALTYWLISYFPSLEAHFATGFIGDVVTMSNIKIYYSVGIFFFIALFCVWKFHVIMNESFHIALFSKEGHGVKHFTHVIYLLSSIWSVFTLGPLYTLSAMFLAPIVLRNRSTGSFGFHLFLLMGLTFIGSLSGFALSLLFERFNSVPTMSVLTFLFAFFTLLFELIRKRMYN